MKVFKFKYSLSVCVLLILVGILACAGLTWNVFSAFEYFANYPVKGVASILTAICCGVLLLIALTTLFNGKYLIKNNQLITKLGLFTYKKDIDQILQLTHFKKSDTLVAYFNDGRYTVIVIEPKQYEDFILSLRKINPAILYDARIDGEDTPS